MYVMPDTEDDAPLPPEMSREDVAKLKDGSIKQAALEAWEDYDWAVKSYQRIMAQAEAIRKCLDEKDGKLALSILNARSRYEDEGFEIVTVDDEYIL